MDVGDEEGDCIVCMPVTWFDMVTVTGTGMVQPEEEKMEGVGRSGARTGACVVSRDAAVVPAVGGATVDAEDEVEVEVCG